MFTLLLQKYSPYIGGQIRIKYVDGELTVQGPAAWTIEGSTFTLMFKWLAVLHELGWVRVHDGWVPLTCVLSLRRREVRRLEDGALIMELPASQVFVTVFRADQKGTLEECGSSVLRERQTAFVPPVPSGRGLAIEL